MQKLIVGFLVGGIVVSLLEALGDIFRHEELRRPLGFGAGGLLHAARNRLPLLTLALLAGCATSGEGPAYPLASKAGYAVVFVSRQWAAPTLWPVTVDIDGRELATLRDGTYTWVYAKPGVRKITSTWPLLSGQSAGAMTIEIAEDKTYYLSVLGYSAAEIVVGGLGWNGRFIGMLDAFSPAPVVTTGSSVVEARNISQPQLTACCKFQRPLQQEY